MNASVHDLIGQIIHPQPALFVSPASPAPVRPPESLNVLIGRIICPEPPARRLAGDAPAPALEVPMPM